MANSNPFLQSPVDALTSLQNEPASGGLPDMSDTRQPTGNKSAPKSENLIPPQNLLPIFEQAAQKYDVPVNVLMALGHQESRFNSRAIGPTTQLGRAKGMMQYLDGTAQGMGINPFDANQSIDAAAKQIRDRLSKGYSMEDAVKEHFAGPDRKLWGKKTDVYGREVMEKAGLIGSAIVGGSSARAETPAAGGLPNMDDERANTQRLLDEEEQGRYRVMTPQQLEEFKLAKQKEEIDGEKAANDKPWTERMADGAIGGYDNTMQALSTARYVMSGGGDAQALAADMSKKIIADSKKQKTTGEKEIDAAFQRVTDAEGAWNTTKEGLKAIGTSIMNPKDLSVAAAEQAANMLPSIVGGVAGAGGGAAVGAGVGATALGAGAVPGAAVGAVWGGRAGMVAGTVITEMGNETEFMVMKRLKEAKLPPTPENIQQILEDKKFITEAQKQGSIKGLTIGVIDQLTLKLGGKLATAPAKSAVAKTAKVGGALVLDSTGEVVGEGTSQKLARGEVDYGDALREGVLSLPTSVAHTAVGAGIEKTNQAFRDPNARAARDLYNEVNNSNFTQDGINQEVVASLNPDNAQMVMTDKAGNVTVRYPAPSSAPGPLSRSVENAAQPVQDARVTVTTPNGKITGFAEQFDQGADGNFNARILGDDGQVYNFTNADGVQIEQQSGPLTSAIDKVAEESSSDFDRVYNSPENAEYKAAGEARAAAYEAYSNDPQNPQKIAAYEQARARWDAANGAFEKVYQSVYGEKPADAAGQTDASQAAPANAVPSETQATQPSESDAGANAAAVKPPALPTLAEMSEAQLRERIKYLADQAKMNGGWNKQLTSERRSVESELNSRPKETPTKVEEPTAKAMPKDLSGAKPRYAYGNKQFDLKFASDVDRAAYIAAQKTPSKRDADYVRFAMDSTGMTEADVRAHGAQVREAIKSQAKDAEPGTLTIAEVARSKPADAKVESKPTKPKTVTKAEADHLFGVDKKRAAAMERIAKGTAYFGTKEKAQDFIAKNGLKDTHTVEQTGKVRFEVKLKASQAAPIEPAQNAPQSEWDAYDAAMTAIPDAEQPSTAKSIEQQKDERRLEQESLEASIPDSVRRGIDQRGWERWAKASGKYVDGAFNSPSQKADAVALIAFEKSATKEQKKRVLQLINVSEEKARKANGNDQRTDDKPNGAKEVRGKNAKGSKAGSTKADQSNQAQEVTGETNGAQTPEAKQAEAQGSEASAAPAAVVKKAKQAPMPTESFDSTAGVGKILAVKERYGDKFGVSWASTNIIGADTMEEAAAIAKAVAESGAENISDMRMVAHAAADKAIKKPDTSLLPKSESAKVNDFLEGRTDTAPTVAEVAAEQAGKAKPDPFANNKIFTADKVEAARARMKSKFGQLNSGIDPEMMIDGMTVAGAYIESGVRKFSDYAAKMIEDFGNGVKPYLLSFYEGARNYPGLDNADMTSVDEAKSQHAAMLKPADVKTEAVGEIAPKPATRAKKTGSKSDMTLTQDWGVDHINGYSDDPKREEGNQVKDAFLKEAKTYLTNVAALLEEQGFTAYQDARGRSQKPVSVNESGMAGSGDVTLVMQGVNGNGVYVNVSETSLRGVVPTTQSGIAIMYRAAPPGDKYGTRGKNTWAPVDLSAADLAKLIVSNVKATVANVAKADTINAQEKENDTKPSSQDAGSGAQGQAAPSLFEDEGGRDTGRVSGTAGVSDTRTGDRGASGARKRQAVSGDTGSNAESAGSQQSDQGSRGSRAPASNRADKQSGNYRIKPGELKREGSWRQTAERNVEIVELIKRIDAEGRKATDAERALMTRFTGWGASEIANGIFPDRYGRFKDATWQALGERLKNALTPTEYDQAKRTTQYAHYTSEGVIRSIYAGLERIGFKGGAIVEPGMGTGLFNGLMPDGMAANSNYTGIEYDTLTGKIAQQLYPDSNIIIGDFTRTNLPKDFFDAAIGNPPFSQTQVTNDPEYKAQRPMLHDYFFMKTIDRVKPGGILVFVTSKGTMDKTSDKSRKYLAARGNLLGAIRLPQTAFKDNAGTEVVTDVIFLQKRGEGIPENGVNWLNTKEVQTPQGPASINEYFADHPEMVLGSHALTGSMYRANEYTVIPQEGVDIEQAFAKAVENLPKSVARVVQGSKAERAIVQDRDFNPKSRKEGGLYLDDKGRLMQVESGTGVELNFRQGSDGKQIALTPKQKKWLRDYVGVRDALKQTQFDQLNDGDWEKSLKALNKAYDAFVKDHGRILDYTTIETTDKDGNVNETKRFKNASLIYTDVEGALAYAMEEIKEDGSIEKGVVLKQRVLDKPKDPEIKTTNDALFVSLNKNGDLDIDDVARLAGTDAKSVINDLGTSIYESPDKGWQLADEYLSGNVVRKLREAQAAAEINPKYKRNVDALLAVQPQPLGPTDITVRLGANWVPPSDIAQFASEVIGDRMAVSYNPVLGAWSIDAQSRNVSEWGFARMQSNDILEAVLNSRQIKVTYRDSEGKTHTDVESTEKANDIAAKMREQFRSWVWKDPVRAERLVKYYNENFNNIAPRKFDGSHLTLPGVSSRFKLYPHQKRAVWRVIQQGDTYLAHAVGAGKTMEMIAAGMEERRLGLSKKPMYVVPNHMLAQFSREFLELYPAANIMVADEQNFHSNNRKRFVAQAALNNPDAIVITHSAFGRISMSDDFSNKFINDQIDKWKETLADIPKEDRVTTKQIERRIEALERRLEGKQGKEKKDKVLDFEELGVDRLFVDEFHEFRKLDFPTNQGNIKGIDPNGSQRALDLYMKVSYLRGKKPGRSLVAASGTPVTNTMGELYTAQRFFQPDQLEEDGTDTFDAWSAQYGDVVTGFEQNAAGGYEMVNRFAKFQNVPELMRRVRSFMDILTSNNLGELVKRPDVIGGGREIKVTPVPDGYKEYQQQLQNRISAIRNRKGPPKKGDDIILSVISDGRFSAIDMRFVDPTRPSDPTSKLNVWVDDIIKAYKDTADYEYADKTTGKPDALKGASVIGFSDIGLGEASAANRGFDMRAWIEKRFADADIPADHVAFMRDYKQHAKKERLFADMREGKKRILIGGKEMETGTNVQKRLANLFHLDAPWFPASVEQREGRIIRQGNQNKEVKINAYATKGSYDSTMWGMNARKARFIEQAMNGDDSVRSLDDVSEASAFEMASALASGDERYLKLAGLKTDVERLERLRHAHYQDQNTLRREKHNAEDLVKNSEKRVKEFETAIAKRKPIKAGEFEGKVEGKTYDNREEFSQALFTAAKALGTAMFDGEKKLAEVGGFDVIYYGIEQKGSGNYAGSLHVDLPGSPDPLMVYPVDPGAPVNGIATRAANQINGMDREVDQAKQRIEQGKARSEQIGKRLGAAFPEEAILMEKVAELSALESELAAEGAAANAEAAAAAAEAEGKQEGEADAEPKYSIAATRDPKELEAIFDNLEKRGLARKRANDSISSDPDAAIIQYVDNNFFDILGDLDDSGKVKIKC